MRVRLPIVLTLAAIWVLGCHPLRAIEPIHADRTDIERAVLHTLDALFNAEPVLINGVMKPFPETTFLRDKKYKVFFRNATSVADSLFEKRGYRKAPDLKKTNLLKFYEGNVILVQFEQDKDGTIRFFWSAGATFGWGFRIKIDKNDPANMIKYEVDGIA